VKRAGKFVIGVIAALGGIYAILFSTGFVFSRLACQTEEKLKIDDPSGLRFELEYTNCDLLAKEGNKRIRRKNIADWTVVLL
jgi:hypothetical protein